jgi:hypothetical protein
MNGILIAEMVQILSSAIGLIVSVHRAAYIHMSVYRMRRDGENGKNLYAGQAARLRELLRLSGHVVFLYFAWAVMDWRLENNIELTVEWIYYSRAFSFTFGSVLFMVMTFSEARSTSVLGEMIEREQRRSHLSRTRSTDRSRGYPGDAA